MKLLAVGHSIVVGYGSTDGQGWRRELTRLVPDVDVVRYAVGGWTTVDALPGLAALILATSPDLVLLELGTNDSGDVPGFEARYGKMLATALDVGTARIAICFEGYPVDRSLALGIARVNDAIYRCAAARGWVAGQSPRFAGFVDFQPIQTSYLSGDGLHPSDAGYDAMAHQIIRGVRPTYGWPAPPADVPALSGHRP